MFNKQKLRYRMPIFITLLGIILLLLLPTGYERMASYQGTDRQAAKVLSCDNSTIISNGLIKSGEQSCKVEILGGRFKGKTAQAINLLTGSLEQDKIFQKGDKARVLISFKENDILSVSMIDHDRIGMEVILAVVFGIFLLFFAGETGLRSILSFLFTVLLIWKVLVPAYLDGHSPILLGILVTFILTIIIISLVYGFDKRTLSAVLGAGLGLFLTAILGALFTDWFKIHGAVMAYSESLLYSGYENLNLTQIFMASIFIGSSGAVMDLAVDITSAVWEVVQKKPDISKKEAILSGIHVGRAAMGTMTTTLLLAYSGGYIALLMVFMAQGTPVINILNYKYVAAEIVQTIVGSFGLVTVAPFTALASGLLLGGRKKIEEETI